MNRVLTFLAVALLGFSLQPAAFAAERPQQRLIECVGKKEPNSPRFTLRLALSGDPDEANEQVVVRGKVFYREFRGATTALDEALVDGIATPKIWYGGVVDLTGVGLSRNRQEFTRVLIYRATSRGSVWLNSVDEPIDFVCSGTLTGT